jgi:hypothetical protein
LMKKSIILSQAQTEGPANRFCLSVGTGRIERQEAKNGHESLRSPPITSISWAL